MTLAINLSHLEQLCDSRGIVEHAQGDRPLRALGYCTDDAGRLLGVLGPVSDDPACSRLCEVALSFLEDASEGADGFRLRRFADVTWSAERSDDATGRALEGLGIAAGSPTEWVRVRARALFEHTVTWRSTHPRSMAHAVIGAVHFLEAVPEHAGARRLLVDARRALDPGDPSRAWPWPETRLAYANALLVEAQLALATHFADGARLDVALTMLEWLIAEETFEGHFSFAPVAGRGPEDAKPAFDQQPIEAWAMARACERAYRVTGATRWAERVALCAAWFDGTNDAHLPVAVPATGAGYDGLRPTSVNTNQGAESTLAYLATMLIRHNIDRGDSVAGMQQRAPVRS
jgi:hypothetical protein